MEYDIVIVGGGTSGTMAAIAAGRMGLKTIIVEKNGFLGGTATGALVAPMMSTNQNDYISDLNEEIRAKLMETGDGFGNWFNPEMLKIVLEELTVRAGVNISYYSHFKGVELKDGKIVKVLIESKGGEESLKGKIFIDASGDADLAAASGVAYESGDSSGKNQPVTIRFQMGNVDIQRFSDFVRELGQTKELDIQRFHTAHTEDGNWPLKPIFEKAIKEGCLLYDDSKYFQCFSIAGRKREIGFNCPEIFETIDGSKSEQLSRAQILGKEKIRRYVNFMKTLPGFEEAYLSVIAPMAGVRESKRVRGRFILTGADILSYRKFETRVISSRYPVDIHDMSQAQREALEKLRKDIEEVERYYDIPWDIMLTEEIENLIVTGRCISADFIAQSAIRIQTVVRALGEAAGYMAALAVKGDKTVKDIDNDVVKILLKQKGFK